jgi:flagellar hook-associated protein 2
MPTGMSGVDQKLVEQLVEVEKIPIAKAKERREKVVEEKKEVEKLQTMLNELDSATSSLKTQQNFYKLKVESSHPDIIDGVVQNYALPGTYEFEVRGLARSEKELAYGFPDKDQTPVGFGFMLVEREDKDPFELVIEPGSTLQDVATQINQAEAGIKAMVINTKYTPDSYRLLVISEKSGKESRILIDEDTTFLEFKEQVTGKNLDILFEDVPVQDEDNSLDELVDGVVFNVKRSEPGTRVQVGVVHDVDATLEGIKGFVEKYNGIASFINDQFKDPRQGEPGLLAADGSIKSVLRQIQGAVYNSPKSDGKYRTLADIGITTDPKSGQLSMDESKVRQALAEDYDSVAGLFIRSQGFAGLGERMSGILRQLRDPGAGMIRSRLRGLESVIRNQDNDISRRERQFEQKEASIRRRFTALEGQMAAMKNQGSFLAQRLGGGGAPQGGGGE